MLRQRILTAVLLAPFLLWAVLWAPADVTAAVIGLAMLVGAWEWSQFCGLKKFVHRIRYVMLIAAALVLAWRFRGDVQIVGAVLISALLWWVLAFIWLTLAPQRGQVWAAALAGLPVLIPTGLALVLLHRVPDLGSQLLLFMLVLVFATDIGAYFAGRAFGRLKLAPLVSPGKTWEGVVGGLTAAVVVALAGAIWFEFDMVAFIGLCTAVAAASIVGDLTESMFKRHAGLKDSGKILPGHGGILDRIDSISAAAPIFALGMLWMGVLQ
jgi:phosphatidate cytidylyltransferase